MAGQARRRVDGALAWRARRWWVMLWRGEPAVVGRTKVRGFEEKNRLRRGKPKAVGAL